MFYHAFAAVPAWAPPGEDHLLYSSGMLTKVQYRTGLVQYSTTDEDGTESLALTFQPASITINGKQMARRPDLTREGYTVKTLENGDYAVQVRRTHIGRIQISNRRGDSQ